MGLYGCVMAYVCVSVSMSVLTFVLFGQVFEKRAIFGKIN